MPLRFHIGSIVTIVLWSTAGAGVPEMQAAEPDTRIGPPGVIYSRSSTEVWVALGNVLHELQLRTRKSAPESGVLVTAWHRFSKSPTAPPRPPLRDDFQPDSFQLHVFVPRTTRPARLYVGSVVRAKRGEQTASFYNAGALELWLVGHVGKQLGDRGESIPDDEGARLAMGRRLHPDLPSDPCMMREPATSVLNERSIDQPTLIDLTKVVPR